MAVDANVATTVLDKPGNPLKQYLDARANRQAMQAEQQKAKQEKRQKNRKEFLEYMKWEPDQYWERFQQPIRDEVDKINKKAARYWDEGFSHDNPDVAKDLMEHQNRIKRIADKSMSIKETIQHHRDYAKSDDNVDEDNYLSRLNDQLMNEEGEFMNPLDVNMDSLINYGDNPFYTDEETGETKSILNINNVKDNLVKQLGKKTIALQREQVGDEFIKETSKELSSKLYGDNLTYDEDGTIVVDTVNEDVWGAAMHDPNMRKIIDHGTKELLEGVQDGEQRKRIKKAYLGSILKPFDEFTVEDSTQLKERKESNKYVFGSKEKDALAEERSNIIQDVKEGKTEHITQLEGTRLSDGGIIEKVEWNPDPDRIPPSKDASEFAEGALITIKREDDDGNITTEERLYDTTKPEFVNRINSLLNKAYGREAGSVTAEELRRYTKAKGKFGKLYSGASQKKKDDDPLGIKD